MKIYCITHVASGLVYVGKTVGSLRRRWNSHCRAAVRKPWTKIRLLQAIRRYGRGAFTVRVLDTTSCQEALDELEMFYIKALKANTKRFGFNMTPGGEGAWQGNTLRVGRKLSDEHKAAISHANRGKKRSPETRIKMGSWQVGRKMSDEARQKMRDFWASRRRPKLVLSLEEKLARRKLANEKRAAATRGKKRSLEARQRMCVAQRLSCGNSEHRARMSKVGQANRGRVLTAEHKQSIALGVIRAWELRRASALSSGLGVV